jgi:hypothetical protein
MTKLGLAALIGLFGCGQSNLASRMATAPSAGEAFEQKCKPAIRDDKPLVVALPSTEKLAMESRVRRGPLVVRYQDCKIELLSRCSAKGAYRYIGGTLKRDTVAAKSADELFAKMPIGAARFSATLEKRGEVAVAMAMVGRFESEGSLDKTALEGECQGATHWVSAITVGAYNMSSGAAAVVGAEAALFGVAEASGKSASSRDTLSQDGDGKACQPAMDTDVRPPQGCGALLRFELEPVKDHVR